MVYILICDNHMLEPRLACKQEAFAVSFLIRVQLPDIPGTLGAVATALGVTPSARARSVVVAGERSASSSAARCRPRRRIVRPGTGRVPADQSVPAPRAG